MKCFYVIIFSALISLSFCLNKSNANDSSKILSQQNQKDKIDIFKFRMNKMKELQKNFTWFNGEKEKMEENFSYKGVAKGKEKFISYFAFLRDSSAKANQVILNKQLRKFRD